MTTAPPPAVEAADRYRRLIARHLADAQRDPHILGLLVFGSVAAGTARPDSDLDLLVVLAEHPEPWGVDKFRQQGIAVERFRFTLEHLAQTCASAPYLLHPFAGARTLYDPEGTVTALLGPLQAYFASHPEVCEVWERHFATHVEDRRLGRCRPTILDAFRELTERFAGGVP